MGIRAFFFDIGGVLVSADVESYLQRGAELFEVSEEEVRANSGELIRDLERGELSGIEFWRTLGRELGRVPDDEECRQLWEQVMLESVEVYLPMLRVCQALARQGYIVGALSNAIADHAKLLRRRGIYAPFSPCVLSCEVGARKPEKPIYWKAAEAAGVPPQQCLLIDDSAHNLPFAREAGFLTHHFLGIEPLLNYLRRWRYLEAHQPTPPLASSVVEVASLGGTPSKEPPLPGPPCNLDQDPWLAGEEQFPWKQELREQLLYCLNFAAMAPSYWNCQAWRFYVEARTLKIALDLGRWVPEIDPHQTQLQVAFGACSQYLEIALRFFGFEVELISSTEPIELRVKGDASISAMDQTSDALAQRFRHLPYVRNDPRPFADPPDELWEALAESTRGLSMRLVPSAGVDPEQMETRLLEELQDPIVWKRVLDCSQRRREQGGWSGRGFGGGALGAWFKERVPGLSAKLRRGVIQKMVGATPRLAMLSSSDDTPEGRFNCGRELALLLLDARRHGLAACWLPQLAGIEPGVGAVVRLGLSHNLYPHPRLPVAELLGAQDTSPDLRTEHDGTLRTSDSETHAQI